MATQEDPYNEETNYLLHRVQPAREQVQLINEVIARSDHQTAIVLLTQLLEISPWAPEFREKRAQAYLAVGDRISAVSDYKSGLMKNILY